MRGVGQWASGPESWGLNRNLPCKKSAKSIIVHFGNCRRYFVRHMKWTRQCEHSVKNAVIMWYSTHFAHYFCTELVPDGKKSQTACQEGRTKSEQEFLLASNVIHWLHWIRTELEINCYAGWKGNDLVHYKKAQHRSCEVSELTMYGRWWLYFELITNVGS